MGHTLISIHALLAESDLERAASAQRPRDFYPRSPRGERRLHNGCTKKNVRFLSTLSSRRATVYRLKLWERFKRISIHALLAESDRQSQRGPQPPADFYPRSPRGERRSKRAAPAARM